MEKRAVEISSKKNSTIKIGVIPGHFATNHSHVNYYVDLTKIKKSYKSAKETARVISMDYITTPVDTIICLEDTQTIGAFLAEQLSDSYSHSVNKGNDICVVSPEMNSNNQMIFRDNNQGMIWNKNILLLISSVSTGWTIHRCFDCLKYYSGKLAAVSALFSAIDSVDGFKVHSVFHMSDLPGYVSQQPGECSLCKDNVKVDAIVNDHGYSKL
ncbi:MAG: orotate phosphoribosyltransferase [Eubacterium sp.]|nr:orotate phosphoribosyltransferase [Eubacterium sp.]